MLQINRLILPLAVAAMVAGTAQAESSDPAETGWLELVKGYRGDVMGAEVREVEAEPGEEGQGQKLVIAIPKASMAHPNEIEEVRVVGQAPKKSKPLLDDFEYRWVENYDDDYYGLLIYYKEGTEVPIRLYMHSREGTIR